MYKYYLLLYSKSKGTHFLPLYTQSVLENLQFNSLWVFIYFYFSPPLCQLHYKHVLSVLF